MIPICRRRCVTLIRNVFVMMNTATSSEKPRANRMPCSVDKRSLLGHCAASRRPLHGNALRQQRGNRLLDFFLVGIRVGLHLGRIDKPSAMPNSCTANQRQVHRSTGAARCNIVRPIKPNHLGRLNEAGFA